MNVTDVTDVTAATNATLDTVTAALLDASGLRNADLEQVLGSTCSGAVDFAEVFFQAHAIESWSLEDGLVKDAAHHVSRGLGVRAISGERTGFAYADDIRLEPLRQAAHAARSVVRQGSAGRVGPFRSADVAARYVGADPGTAFDATAKVRHLRALDQRARAADPRVCEVTVSLTTSFEQCLVVASDGTFAADIRPLTRVNVGVIVEQGGRRERGNAGCGGRHALARLFEDGRADQLVDEAVRIALVALEAVPAPAGVMPVVLGPGWPGVLLHEAVGHGLEADFNRKGTSVFSGRVGQQVASPLCTVVDDGTLAERRGSLSIDDEGTPSARNVLIERGVLRGYMQDRHNARLMGERPTGNGRRESYAHLPMPRMTNTCMLAGDDDPADIIRSVQRGLYAVNLGGGQVDLTSGNFVFSTTEAYLIEDGRITAPVKGATLIGNGPQAMQRVSMVGGDLQLDPGVGVCGKDGQSVPVGVGQPTLKVDQLTVGGTGG